MTIQLYIIYCDTVNDVMDMVFTYHIYSYP